MPKPKGPPYTEPGCKYVVIDNPWPGGKSGKARDARYFNYVAVWLSMILSPRVWPEELYYVSTVCHQFVSCSGSVGQQEEPAISRAYMDVLRQCLLIPDCVLLAEA